MSHIERMIIREDVLAPEPGINAGREFLGDGNEFLATVQGASTGNNYRCLGLTQPLRHRSDVLGGRCGRRLEPTNLVRGPL